MKRQNKARNKVKVLQESVEKVKDIKEIEKNKDLKKVNISDMSLETFRDLF